jgi:hypothetical protein
LGCDAALLRDAINVQILERHLKPFTEVSASPAIQNGYSTAAKKASRLRLTWQEAEILTNQLIRPVLDGTVPSGRWNPRVGVWVTRE